MSKVTNTNDRSMDQVTRHSCGCGGAHAKDQELQLDEKMQSTEHDHKHPHQSGDHAGCCGPSKSTGQPPAVSSQAKP